MGEINNKVIGRIKLAAAVLTDSDRRAGEGRVDGAKGKLKVAVEAVEQAVERAVKK